MDWERDQLVARQPAPARYSHATAGRPVESKASRHDAAIYNLASELTRANTARSLASRRVERGRDPGHVANASYPGLSGSRRTLRRGLSLELCFALLLFSPADLTSAGAAWRGHVALSAPVPTYGGTGASGGGWLRYY